MSEEQSFQPVITVDPSEAVKRPRLEAILFCEYGALTAQGKYVLGGTFERIIFTHEEPKAHEFYLFIRTGETREGTLQVAVYTPQGKIIFAVSVNLTTPNEMAGYPAQLQYLDKLKMPFPFEGVYWFDVAFKGTSLGGTALIVEFQKPEAKPEAEEDEHRTEPVEERP